jgi:hypothetical protein
LGSGHFHFLKAFRVLIENGTFSQTTGAIWAWLLLEQFAGFYPILLCILKKNVLKEV